MVPWTHTSQLPKQHLDQFGRFFAQPNRVPNTKTDRHTDHVMCDICGNRSQCVLCGVTVSSLLQCKRSLLVLLLFNRLAEKNFFEMIYFMSSGT